MQILMSLPEVSLPYQRLSISLTLPLISCLLPLHPYPGTRSVCGACLQTFDLRFPQPFSDLLAGLKYPALDFKLASTGIDCFHPTNFFDYVLTITLAPIILIAVAPAVLYAAKMRKIKTQRLASLSISISGVNRDESPRASTAGSSKQVPRQRTRNSLMSDMKDVLAKDSRTVLQLCLSLVLIVACE